MKKLVFILLALTLFATMLVGCAPSAGLNAHNTSIAQMSINALDDYIDGKIDARTTIETTAEIRNEIDLNEKEDNDVDAARQLSLLINDAGLILVPVALGDEEKIENLNELLRIRNQIARLAGLDTRRSV